MYPPREAKQAERFDVTETLGPSLIQIEGWI